MIFTIDEYFVSPIMIIFDVQENEHQNKVVVPYVGYNGFAKGMIIKLIPLYTKSNSEHLKIKKGIRTYQIYF